MKWSVIIPLGRPETAAPTMASLMAQSVKPPDWEILVVGVQAAELPARYPQLPLHPVALDEIQLPARTRIEGVRRATGDWYLFVDDDIELAPNFMEALLPLAREPKRGAIGARLPGRQGVYFEWLTDLTNFWSQQALTAGTRDWLYSATLAVSAEAYRAAGGFNPEFPVGEDVDLTQRMIRQGYQLWYEPRMVAYHHHRRDSLFSLWRYLRENGRSAAFSHQYYRFPRVFSIKTAWSSARLNLAHNLRLNGPGSRKVRWHAPLLFLNYLIFQCSIEWHYQRQLFQDASYRGLAPQRPSDQFFIRAANAWLNGHRLFGMGCYAAGMALDFFNPRRR